VLESNFETSENYDSLSKDQESSIDPQILPEHMINELNKRQTKLPD